MRKEHAIAICKAGVVWRFNTHDSFRSQFTLVGDSRLCFLQGWLNYPNISSNYSSNTKIA